MAQGDHGMKDKIGDEAEYEKISRMTESELLDYVLGAPHLLCDGYYRGYDTAIYARYAVLLARREAEA
jgi:hypothetical protein